MREFYEQLSRRAQAIRQEAVGAEPKIFVGSFAGRLSPHGRLALPESFELPPGAELLVGLHSSGDCLVGYASSISLLFDDVSVPGVRAAMQELEIRRDGAGPVMLRVEPDGMLTLPSYLVQAAGIAEQVLIEGHAQSFLIRGD